MKVYLIMNSISKFSLVLCELHYLLIHGKTESSCPIIETHFMLISKFNPFTRCAMDDGANFVVEIDETIEEFQENYTDEYEMLDIDIPHPTIRNYENIVRREDYIKPQIGLCIELPTGEMVVIIKTFWIKIIQRAWKRVYKERKEIINGQKMIESISTRKMTGRFPNGYRYLPTLNGLLN